MVASSQSASVCVIDSANRDCSNDIGLAPLPLTTGTSSALTPFGLAIQPSARATSWSRVKHARVRPMCS